MKKLFILILFILGLNTFTPIVNAQADIATLVKNMGYTIDPKTIPKASIVVDANSGAILWQDNIDLQRDPASISKVMVLYLLYEAIENGQLTMDTQITATKTDAIISQLPGLSNNKIIANVSYPIKELIPMILVSSSNVATIMVANYLSNNDLDAFVDKMNDKARTFGMNDTKFYNPTGASSDNYNGYASTKQYDNTLPNISTARDLSILGINFLKKYNQALTYSKDKQYTVMANTPYEQTLMSHNYSLKGTKYELDGTDGLKTGSSETAGWSIMMTTKQNQHRVITIILGSGDFNIQAHEQNRHLFANAVTQYAFDHYDYIKAMDIGTHTLGDYTFYVPNPIWITTSKDNLPTVTLHNHHISFTDNLQYIGEYSQKNYPVDNIHAVTQESKTNVTDFSITLTIGSILFLIVFFSIFRLLTKK